MSRFIHRPSLPTAPPRPRRPTTVREQHGENFNGRLAKVITEAVGTMWCAYAFAALALVALPSAIKGGPLSIVQWISQTFLQLVLLSVIMVGQKVIGRASDERALQAYSDAAAVLHETQQIQARLVSQDAALEAIRQRLGVEPAQGGKLDPTSGGAPVDVG